MLGAILAGAVLGLASLIILKGGNGPQPKAVPVKTKDRPNARDQ